ncbi:hypothetical protein ACIPDW_31910 [Streptomyces sp. NPDC087290]|uniref:hypothetical protein n=1 Tax=Streptomyces sp. NPDC087290 TaxID=3365776 RepID=UPI0038122C98
MRRLSGTGALGLKAGLGRVCEEDTCRAALRTDTTEAGRNAATAVGQLLGGRGGGFPEPAQGGGPPAGQVADTLAGPPE